MSLLAFYKAQFWALTFFDILNGLTLNLRCRLKLPIIVQDAKAIASDINHDLNLITLWVHSRRMVFNPDIRKQAVELKF